MWYWLAGLWGAAGGCYFTDYESGICDYFEPRPTRYVLGSF